MLLQYTNETAIYLSLILIPHKSFVQPANDTLCNILWQNNSQVRSNSHLVSGVFTEVRVLKTLEHGFTQPAEAENWHVLIDFLVQEFRLLTGQLKHWYCFVRMCMEKLQSSYSLFLHIELLHPTPEIYHKYYSWIKWFLCRQGRWGASADILTWAASSSSPQLLTFFFCRMHMEGLLKSCNRWWHRLWPRVSRYKPLFAFQLYLTELCYKAMVKNFEFWMTILKLQKKHKLYYEEAWIMIVWIVLFMYCLL